MCPHLRLLLLLILLLLIVDTSLTLSWAGIRIVGASAAAGCDGTIDKTTPSFSYSGWTIPNEGLALDTVLGNRRLEGQQRQEQQQLRGRPNDNNSKQQTPFNLTLPLALTIIAPDLFPSLSKARRTIRQQRIQVIQGQHQQQLQQQPTTTSHNQNVTHETTISTSTTTITTILIGKSDTRIYPGDSIRMIPSQPLHQPHQQDDESSPRTTIDTTTTTDSAAPMTTPTSSSTRGYPNLAYSKLAGILPTVMYEDDDVAIIHKLAGMICHSMEKGGYDTNSVLRVAPLILTPPSTRMIPATDILPWPSLVHRLDTRTSGLLLLAKTRTATKSLSVQFELERSVSKTYHAIVEGRPNTTTATAAAVTQHSVSSSSSSYSSYSSSWGPVGTSDNTTNRPTSTNHNSNNINADYTDNTNQINDMEEGRIESMVDGKVAITHYKVLDSMPTTRGIPITLIEFTPITGRKHQLRHHAAYELHCPIVGDTQYGSSWSNYLYLCSTRIACRHPRAGTPLSCIDHNDNDDENDTKNSNNMARIEAEIPIPKRFHKFWEREKKRYEGYQRWVSSEQTES